MTTLMLSVLLLAAGAPAGHPAGQDTTAATQEAPKESLICRRSKVAGSRMSRRVCLSAEQWRAADAEAASQKESTMQNATRNGREDWLGPVPK